MQRMCERRSWAWDPLAPSTCYCDNAAALLVANGDGTAKRLKHVSIREFYCKSMVEAGEIEVLRVPSAENVADMNTKCQPLPLFREHSVLALGA